MNRGMWKAAFVAILFLLTPMLSQVSPATILSEDNTPDNSSTGNLSLVDVPNYRIGDKWVYETKFDVAQLIAQANVSASLNTLTGDTVKTVTDILYETDENGKSVLVYEITIDGSFSSGNNGATLEGTSGRLEIDYDGTDIIRARDLATRESNFNLDVTFAPFNLGFLSVTLGDINFDNSYTPAKETHDFPLRNGDQWYMPFRADTVVTGTSDYFDPSEFDGGGPENYSWQVIKNEAPSEDGVTPQYLGCDNSYKISEWNETGVNTGFNWYCPDARGSAWNRIINPAGFTIDWILKTYNPSDSNSVIPASSPGGRNTNLNVATAYSATLPDSTETISIDYNVVGSPPNPIANTNLQLRYEIAETILNPTTDQNGMAQIPLDVSNETDTTPSSDDHTSNGVVVYDPAAKIVGAATVVQDLSVVGIDLIAQPSSVIVERTRGGVTTTLGASIGYNALPGDMMMFSLPAQNRGVLTSPATYMEIETPDGATYREPISAIAAYSEERVIVNWGVPENLAVGFKNLKFTVDPDMNVTADANRSNNDATIEIFIGRAPTAVLEATEGKYTFENVTLNATGSYDEDGGNVDCVFEIESRVGLIDVIEAPGCLTHWNWSNSGTWSVTVSVVDGELDVDELQIDVIILNRAPVFNLSHDATVPVEQSITINAVNIQDIDTSSPTGQQVSISWPGLECNEGLTQPTCTFIPTSEGPMNITAIATDDDGATTTVTSPLDVLNIAPTIGFPELWTGGEQLLQDANGTWHLDEDEIALLRVVADDTSNDQGTLIVEWLPSIEDENWTLTSIGISSSEAVAWTASGIHTLNVRAIDSDGATSSTQTGEVLIHNVAPTVTGLPGNTPVFEEDNLSLEVVASDTASDVPTLEICWDFNAIIDEDNDGIKNNDCELSGASISKSWSTTGVRWITVTVTDDDGATATQSMNVSVLNLPPTAIITLGSLADSLVEGDNLTLDGTESVETAGDKTTLIYQWDASFLDTDLDGSKVGDVDHLGGMWTIEDLPAGTWTIVLTVTDDDGEFQQTELSFVVSEAPSEGLFESISGTVGTTMTYVIFILGIVITGLVAFLLFTRKRPSDDLKGFSAFDQPFEAAPVAAAPVEPAPQPTSYAPQPAAVPEPVYQAPEAVNTGPPIPATGLPEGWTMEQWSYYGEQWLAANPAPAPIQQPIVSNPAPAPASTELQSLLDDLDF
ncbi:MAG: hypothetical protein P8Q40_04180 [Candidatus Poseidonia sp.]|uniref:hypothetical protein n=1 Tax=Poseidonia sp. TaxID=2666344 RepID=UPI0030BF8F20|nr:hypothetical protein [Poseidonia sp.]